MIDVILSDVWEVEAQAHRRALRTVPLLAQNPDIQGHPHKTEVRKAQMEST